MSSSLIRAIQKDAAERIAAALKPITLVKPTEAARLLSIGLRQVNEQLPIVKLGPKTHRVKISDIEEFVSRRTMR